MRQFIKDNRPYSQTDIDAYIELYLEDGCEEVPVLYEGGLYHPIWTGQAFEEGASVEEIRNIKKDAAILIDSEYTSLISKVLRKAMEDLLTEEIPIPQTILDERNRLRTECNQKIADLGIDVSVYRESNRKTITLT